MNREIKYRAFLGNQMLPVGAMEFFIDGSVHVQCGDDWSPIGEQWGNYLMQWTGYRDIAGHDIYESDILLTPGGQRLEVCIDDLIHGDAKFHHIDVSACTVLGNVHEQPDLCGKQEEQP